MTSTEFRPGTAIKRRIFGLETALWAGVLGALRGSFASRAVELSFEDRRRVLFLAPHPDDELLGGGGALLRHKAAGDAVLIAYLTDGRRSGALGLPQEEMARRRKAEASACAGLLSNRLPQWIGLPEGRWVVEALTGPLKALMETYSPQLVYAPSRVDYHPEHRKAAVSFSRALKDLDPRLLPPVLRIYPVQVPLTPLLANGLTTMEGLEPALEAALSQYATQAGSLHAFWRLRRYAAALHRRRGFVEEFLQLSPRGYIRLHELPPGQLESAGWRGLRPHPLSDPLAFLQGNGQRRRFAREISEENLPPGREMRP